MIKHTPFINFRENGMDTNGTIIVESRFPLLFMNGCNIGLFQFWEKNWNEQWVIEVMMGKVRKYILVWFDHFLRDVIFLTCFFLIWVLQCLVGFFFISIVEREWHTFAIKCLIFNIPGWYLNVSIACKTKSWWVDTFAWLLISYSIFKLSTILLEKELKVSASSSFLFIVSAIS